MRYSDKKKGNIRSDVLLHSISRTQKLGTVKFLSFDIIPNKNQKAQEYKNNASLKKFIPNFLISEFNQFHTVFKT